jgi:beta-glucanase (GH16 family)
LDKKSSSDVSFQYDTQGGTAKENVDFIPVSGVLTIPAGSQTGSIKVTVTGDSTRKATQSFSLVLSEPKNCTLPTAPINGTIRNDNGLYFPVDNNGYNPPSPVGWTLVWSDEFSGKIINTNNWQFEIGNNNGWGNHEQEYYTNSTNNAFVSQGNLIIEARGEAIAGFNYSSTRMITKGKQSFKYGRVDIRAKLPQTKGIWPALWMLGDNIDTAGWPACGEIDMMELLGQEPNKVYGTLHWGASPAAHQSYGTNKVLSSGTFADSFHVYSMIWTSTSISLLIDDVSYFTMATTGPNLPFNSSFFFIFNIAVGGDWPGAPDSSTQLPQRMVVDYIRVFQ